MRRLTFSLAAALLALSAAPAAGGTAGFTIVNQTGADMTAVAIRRVGTQDWRPIGVAPRAGAPAAVEFQNEDCAFDIRADLAGAGPIVWLGVNLCEAKLVRLNRDAAGALWVDYD